MAALRRQIEPHTSRQRLLIVCEGKTEETYFSALKSHTNARKKFHLTVRCPNPGTGDQLKLVYWANRFYKQRGKANTFDKVWCIFDLEQPPKQPSFQQAIEEAGRKNFQVCASNPCFEVWLLLHFEDISRPYSGSYNAKEELNARFPNGIDITDVDWMTRNICGPDFGGCRKAVERAGRLYDPKLTSVDVAGRNPSTNILSLVGKLVGM